MKHKQHVYIFIALSILLTHSSCHRSGNRERTITQPRRETVEPVRQRSGSGKSTVKMRKSGGVYYVPCKLNGTEMEFIFDTGASDITISLTEAMFLSKQGKLEDSDFIGVERYLIADGSVHEGTTINLRQVEIGNRTLFNVRASIGTLGEYLQNVNSYLQKVQALDDKLDNYANRTQFMEHASRFYAKHEHRLTENIETANRAMQNSVEEYNKSVARAMQGMQEKLEEQSRDILRFGETIQQRQQAALNEKTKEIELIVEALQKQTETLQKQTEQNNSIAATVEKTMNNLERSTIEQNKKIDKLTAAILNVVKATEKTETTEKKQNNTVARVEKIEKTSTRHTENLLEPGKKNVKPDKLTAAVLNLIKATGKIPKNTKKTVVRIEKNMENRISRLKNSAKIISQKITRMFNHKKSKRS